MLEQEPGWDFGQDTGVSTATLTMSVMGSLVTTWSQYNVTFESWPSSTGQSPHLCPGALVILHRPEE